VRGHAGKRPKSPLIKYDNSNASYMCVPSRVGHDDSMRCTTGSTGVTFCGEAMEAGAQQPWAARVDAETIQAIEQRGVGEFLAEIQRRCGQADIVLPR